MTGKYNNRFIGMDSDENSIFLLQWIKNFIPIKIPIYFATYNGNGIFKCQDCKIEFPSDCFPILIDSQNIAHCAINCFEWFWNFIQNAEIILEKELKIRALNILSDKLHDIRFVLPNEIEDYYEEISKENQDNQDNDPQDNMEKKGSRIRPIEPKSDYGERDHSRDHLNKSDEYDEKIPVANLRPKKRSSMTNKMNTYDYNNKHQNEQGNEEEEMIDDYETFASVISDEERIKPTQQFKKTISAKDFKLKQDKRNLKNNGKDLNKKMLDPKIREEIEDLLRHNEAVKHPDERNNEKNNEKDKKSDKPKKVIKKEKLLKNKDENQTKRNHKNNKQKKQIIVEESDDEESDLNVKQSSENEIEEKEEEIKNNSNRKTNHKKFIIDDLNDDNDNFDDFNKKILKNKQLPIGKNKKIIQEKQSMKTIQPIKLSARELKLRSENAKPLSQEEIERRKMEFGKDI